MVVQCSMTCGAGGVCQQRHIQQGQIPSFPCATVCCRPRIESGTQCDLRPQSSSTRRLPGRRGWSSWSACKSDLRSTELACISQLAETGLPFGWQLERAFKLKCSCVNGLASSGGVGEVCIKRQQSAAHGGAAIVCVQGQHRADGMNPQA